MPSVPVMPSEVSILKTRAAAKKGLGKGVGGTETVWPKPEFVSYFPPACFKQYFLHRPDGPCDKGPGTTIDWMTREGRTADGFIIPAG